MQTQKKRIPTGFSRMELIIIIVAAILFITLLFPAIHLGRAAYQKSVCSNNLHQLTMAAQSYCDSNGTWPLLGCHSIGKDQLKEDQTVRYNYPRIHSIVALMPFLGYTDTSIEILGMDKFSDDGAKNTVASVTPDVPSFGIQIPLLKCPVDLAPLWTGEPYQGVETPLAGRNYLYCSGDFPDAGAYKYCNLNKDTANAEALLDYNIYNNNTRTGISSMEYYRRSDYISDGVSNSILWGEKLRGIKDSRVSLRGSKIGVIGRYNINPVNTNPGPECLSSVILKDGSHEWDKTIRLMNMTGGVRAYCATSTSAAFSTILSPNAPACLADYDDRALQSISSNHPGGALVAMYDGSTRFIANKINVLSQGVERPVIKDEGPSDFGVWGALGSVNGSEKESL